MNIRKKIIKIIPILLISFLTDKGIAVEYVDKESSGACSIDGKGC